MSRELEEICRVVRNYPGLKRKQPLREVYDILRSTHCFGTQLPNFGDDAAVIPWANNYLLLAIDGIMPQLVLNEPYAAGKSAVMVTVSDIYAMGGRPLGMVNVLSSGDREQRVQIVQGIEKGCKKLQVPMMGGHLHPDAAWDQPALSVAILGWAEHLLRSHLAAAGDDLILAVDLQGRAGCYSVKSWDANSGKTSQEVLHRLEALPLIAASGWSKAAKDISNAGLLGTIAIMLENSNQGGLLDLDAIPCPGEMNFIDWLHCFQSFGFVLAVPPVYSEQVINLFAQHQVTAAVVGKVTKGPAIIISRGNEQAELFNLLYDGITGISCV